MKILHKKEFVNQHKSMKYIYNKYYSILHCTPLILKHQKVKALAHPGNFGTGFRKKDNVYYWRYDSITAIKSAKQSHEAGNSKH